MNPYLLTLTFLMLMTVLTSSEVARFAQNNLGNQTHTDFQKSLLAAEEAKTQAALDDFRKQMSEDEKDKEIREQNKKPKPSTSIRRSAPLGFNLTRPPNNARLNFYALLHKKPSGPFSLRETVARLMRSLYTGAKFFDAVPQIEYHILEALKDQETENFKYPDELGILEFENENVQKVFYAMLKGAEGRPSLLNFITFDKEGSSNMKKVNLMFAAPCIIEALFEDPKISAQLIALRDAQWEEILDQEAHRLERTKEECKGRREFKKELKEGYERILSEAGLDSKQYNTALDISLGKLGNTLFIEDPITGFVRREKYVPKRSAAG